MIVCATEKSVLARGNERVVVNATGSVLDADGVELGLPTDSYVVREANLGTGECELVVKPFQVDEETGHIKVVRELFKAPLTFIPARR